MRIKPFKKPFWAIIILLSLFSGALAQIKNPVIDADFPDPTVVRFGKFYYAYATQGKSHIQAARSADLQHWEMLPDVLPQAPVWADKHYWAPHVLYDASIKKYILFYSGESIDDKIGKCLGVAFADKPEGPFIDKGTPLLCGDGFINIDPMAMIDPKTKRSCFTGDQDLNRSKYRKWPTTGKRLKQVQNQKILFGQKRKISILI